MDSTQSLEVRPSLYALLSRLFTYPLDAEVLSLVAGISFDEVPAEPVAGPALTQMQCALADGGSLPDLIEALNCEATRLFEGPGRPAAPPFGSFYLNGQQLMGPETVAVGRAYLEAQLLPERNGNTPSDHLALELGFMAALAETESPGKLAASRDFLTQHLLKWVPAWRADVLAAAPHPFFTGLADFTQAVLEADLAWLDETNPMLAGSPDHLGNKPQVYSLTGDGGAVPSNRATEMKG
ncbi:MAG: TorD/DmsD family molecular chaperone [Sulfuricella sp.]